MWDKCKRQSRRRLGLLAAGLCPWCSLKDLCKMSTAVFQRQTAPCRCLSKYSYCEWIGSGTESPSVSEVCFSSSTKVTQLMLFLQNLIQCADSCRPHLCSHTDESLTGKVRTPLRIPGNSRAGPKADCWIALPVCKLKTCASPEAVAQQALISTKGNSPAPCYYVARSAAGRTTNCHVLVR